MLSLNHQRLHGLTLTLQDRLGNANGNGMRDLRVVEDSTITSASGDKGGPFQTWRHDCNQGPHHGKLATLVSASHNFSIITH